MSVLLLRTTTAQPAQIVVSGTVVAAFCKLFERVWDGAGEFGGHAPMTTR